MTSPTVFSPLLRGSDWPNGLAGDLTAADLAGVYGYPDPLPQRGWVRGSMLSTVDGAASGGDGKSASISLAPDRVMLATLRALADVVLVGAGTARAEAYRRTEPKERFAAARAAAGQAPSPAIAVVTGTGDVSEELLAPGGGALFVLVATDTPADRVARLRERLLPGDDLVVVGGAHADPDLAVQALVERGLLRVVCEGGPTWLTTLAAAGRLDELCLTTSPFLAGGNGSRITNGPQVPDELRTLRLHHVLTSGDALFTRWVMGAPTGG